jgi:CRISPR-associated endonuclease/helicase Cas3
VSTQTIEAGVDLDFDMAFRDFAPIDSLIQTAGRVNRSGRKGNYLPVYIVQLGNDNQYVYGLSHRKHTEYLLKGKNEILENEYGKLAEEYYQLALNDGVDDKSIEIWDGMMKLDFEAVEKFRLIKNIEEVCDVFVEINEFASSLADAFEKVLSYDGQSNFDYDLSNVLWENYASKFNGRLSPFEIKAILRLIKAKMNDFIIQVRISRMLENKPLEFKVRGEVQCDLYWIPPEDVSRYYDENTGFIDKSGKALIY